MILPPTALTAPSTRRRTLGTIKKLDHERGIATVEVGPRRFRLDLKEPKALDHAYAVTSHRSQGLSRERVYLTVDTSHSQELVNRRQFT
jgi:ATP-dependent exoDNAse (exonuclease V) alpha subunit